MRQEACHHLSRIDRVKHHPFGLSQQQNSIQAAFSGIAIAAPDELIVDFELAPLILRIALKQTTKLPPPLLQPLIADCPLLINADTDERRPDSFFSQSEQ